MRISLQLLSLLSIPIPFNSFIYNNRNAIILRKPLRTSSCLLRANNKTSHIYKINFNNNNNNDDEFNLYEYRMFTLNLCVIYLCFNYLSSFF